MPWEFLFSLEAGLHMPSHAQQSLTQLDVADDNMKRGRRRRGPGNVSAQRPSLLFVANSVFEAPQKPLNFLRILVGK
jgi:hypothetical protein